MQSDIVQRLQNMQRDYAGMRVGAIVREAATEITRLTEALRAAEEREKGLREGLTLAANRMDVMALAVSHENNARRYEWHEWAVAARAALKGPSHDA